MDSGAQALGYASVFGFEVNEECFAPGILRQHHDQPPPFLSWMRLTVSDLSWHLGTAIASNAQSTYGQSVHPGSRYASFDSVREARDMAPPKMDCMI